MRFKIDKPYSVILDISGGMSSEQCKVKCFDNDLHNTSNFGEILFDLLTGQYDLCENYFFSLAKRLERDRHKVVFVKPHVWYTPYRFVINYGEDELKHLKQLTKEQALKKEHYL